MTTLPARVTRPRLAGVLAAAVLIATTGLAGRALLGSRPAVPAHAADPSVVSSAEPIAAPDGLAGSVDPSIARLDSAVAIWTANLQDDGADWVSADNLAVVEYSRGRLTGSIDDYVRADRATGVSLATYPGDLAAQSLHAVLRQSLHDFGAALTLAESIYRSHPDQLQALATVADADLELGRYDAAAQNLATLEKKSPGAATTARLAHLAALRGDDAGAKSLAERSIAEARAAGSEGPSLAWYEQLAGTLAFQNGRLVDAESAFRAALADWPGSYAGLAGLGKTLAAEGRYDDAIAAYQKAVAIVPQPEYLAALGDLYELTGRRSLAAEEQATVKLTGQLAAIQRQVYNRQLVLFETNHGLDPSGAVKLARTEIAVRKDVYGWDALAWALLADRQPAAADAAMRNALSQGTHDALFEYHAGMIAAALGDTARARAHLNAALSLNPGFDPLQAQRARAQLAALR